MKLNVYASVAIAALISAAQAGPLPQQSASLGYVFAQADSEAQPVEKGFLPKEGDAQHGSEIYTRALLSGQKGGVTVTAQVDTAEDADATKDDPMGIYHKPNKAEGQNNYEIAKAAIDLAKKRGDYGKGESYTFKGQAK